MNLTKLTRKSPLHRSGDISSNHTNLHLHINRLTLTGLSQINQDRVVDALQRRLSALVAQIPNPNWSQIPEALTINGGNIPSDITSERLGEHLANQIMRHITRAGTTDEPSP